MRCRFNTLTIGQTVLLVELCTQRTSSPAWSSLESASARVERASIRGTSFINWDITLTIPVRERCCALADVWQGGLDGN